MIISFTINTSRQTLEKQWKYLVKRGNWNREFFRNIFLGFIIALILFIAFCFLTPADDFIVLKAISAYTLFIGYFIIFPVALFIKKKRNNQRFAALISSIISLRQLSYNVHIDEGCVKTTSGENNNEMPWSQFTRYGIHDNTLYLFNDQNSMHSLFWDRSEMGNENYMAVIDFIKQKPVKQMF